MKLLGVVIATSVCGLGSGTFSDHKAALGNMFEGLAAGAPENKKCAFTREEQLEVAAVLITITKPGMDIDSIPEPALLARIEDCDEAELRALFTETHSVLVELYKAQMTRMFNGASASVVELEKNIEILTAKKNDIAESVRATTARFQDVKLYLAPFIAEESDAKTTAPVDEALLEMITSACVGGMSMEMFDTRFKAWATANDLREKCLATVRAFQTNADEVVNEAIGTTLIDSHIAELRALIETARDHMAFAAVMKTQLDTDVVTF